MAVATADEFLDVLEKSELLEPEQFGEARAALLKGDDAKALATRLVQAQLLTEWQASQILVGRDLFFLGKYKLIEMLGRGGMGAVFLAEHLTMNRRVALKTISRKVSKEPKALERFLDEARAVAALDHPNIVQAYNVDEEDERFFLVMEYVDGQDLEQLVQSEGPLEPGRAADYIRQAAEGLEHGHGRNMIHCDIKPSNLLLNGQDAIKIVDMGLAHLQDPSEARKTDDSSDHVLGSVDFLAPEQAMGGKNFDHRADIYSLGCTLYYLLTGQPPFPEGMLHEKLMRHQAMQPESIGKLRAEVPTGLVNVCEKMMAKKPDERYQSAAEVGKALAEFPAPKRRMKRAAPLRTAAPLPQPGQQMLPAVDVGGSRRGTARKPAAAALPSVQTGQRRATAGRAATRKKSPLFDSPRQKMIAAGAVGVGLVVLLAILVPYMLRSSDSGQSEPKPKDWLNSISKKNQSKQDERQPPTPGKPPASSRKTPPGDPSGKPYRIVPEGLCSGAMAYIDRPHTLVSVPSSLEGATYLQTANDDKRSKGDAFLSFGIDGDATVYVGYDDRLKNRKPSWLSGFTDTGDDLVGPETENLRLRLLKKDFPAGTVTLGGNGGKDNSCAMYLVVLVPRSGSELIVSYKDIVPPGEAIAVAKPPTGQPAEKAAVVPKERRGTTVADPVGAVAIHAADSKEVSKTPSTKEPISPAPARKLLVAEGLVSRFTFDEDGSDGAGQHKGAFMGDATVAEDPDRGSVLKLDGQGDYVSFAGMVDVTGGEYSVTLWFKSRAGAHKTLIAGTKATHGMLLELKDGKLRYLHRFPLNSKADTSVYSDKTYNDGQWHHVVAVKDSAGATLYVDGVKVGSLPNTTTFNVPLKFVAGRLSISQGERYFHGFIDDLRFYKRALTPEEAAKVAAPEPTPFDNLAATGKLKRFDRQSVPAGAQALGELILPPQATLDFTLLGGAGAIRGPRKFVMKPAEDGKQWHIYLEVQSKTQDSPQQTAVARVLLKDQFFGLAWAPGVTREVANSLLNCALNISVDDETYFLPLAKPQTVEPLTVNLDAGAARTNIPVESFPELESLQLEIVRLTGGFPKPQFKPGNTVVPGGASEITFPAKDFPKFRLRLGFDLKSRIAAVDVTANIDYELPGVSPQVFKAREAGRFMKDLTNQRRQLVAQLEKTKDGRKRGEINKKLKPITATTKRFTKLNAIYGRLKKKPAKVQFRIYTVIDGEHQVTLIRSKPAAKPTPTEPPPSDGAGPE